MVEESNISGINNNHTFLLLFQNPSDADATCSGRKGQGYQVQVMETYCKDGESDTSLNLIAHTEVGPSHESDETL